MSPYIQYFYYYNWRYKRHSCLWHEQKNISQKLILIWKQLLFELIFSMIQNQSISFFQLLSLEKKIEREKTKCEVLY